MSGDTYVCEDPDVIESTDLLSDNSSGLLSEESADIDNCGGLASSLEGVGALNIFLAHVNNSIFYWKEWRKGIGVRGDEIPDLGTLQEAYRDFSSFLPLACANDRCSGLGVNEPEVATIINEEIDASDRGFLAEYLAFSASKGFVMPQGFLDIWGLQPEPAMHTYKIKFLNEVQGSVGGFKVIDAGGLLSRVLIMHSNSYSDLGWAASYNLIGAKVSGGASIGTPASLSYQEATTRGLSAVCQGSSDETALLYSPEDFSGFCVESSASIGAGGVFFDAEHASSTFEVEVNHPIFQTMSFDTSGPCHMAGVNINLEANSGSGEFVGGYLWHAENLGVGQSPPPEAGHPAGTGPSHALQSSAPRVLITRSIYFNTGGHDVLSDPLYGASNQDTLLEIVNALELAHEQTPVRQLNVSLVGHASPKWRDAADEIEAMEKNIELAELRLQSALGTLRSGAQALGEDFPEMVPTREVEALNMSTLDDPAIANAEPILLRSPGGTTEELTDPGQTNLGSSMGMSETGNPDNNDLRYRRVDIEVTITTVERVRQAEPRDCE